MATRSPSPARGRYRSRSRTRTHTRSLSPRSDISRSSDRRRRYSSRSPARSPTPPRRNGRHRSRSRSYSRESSPVRSTKIVVERLSKNINEQHLQEIFGQFGRIKDLDLPINRTFGTNRGTAYILYDHETDAEEAIAHMHEAQVDGATINVSIVLPRRRLSPAPPTARRGANIDPRVPFTGPRGGVAGASAGGSGGNVAGGGGRRRMSPGNRYGQRSDVYRPGSRSNSRSPGPPPSRGGGSRFRSHSKDSYSSRSRSRSPTGPRRRGGGSGGRHDDHDMRRRSVSRSSYDSYGDRSRSRSRGRGHR
ncbi:hypothetical protein B0T10DRAFT_64640 [Thelonectria olida]|uniref:RRM domain-containing protein n=1 Tax=Thelonectria olida TaxID=1576542 RepID=A0A9P8W1W0_9HYPO|nr:hypothetical protein B0T10DRAFT_64640 [Thelonectria olida]